MSEIKNANPAHQRRIRLQTAILLFVGIAPAEFNWAYNPILVRWPAFFWSVDIFRFVVLPAIVFWWGVHHRLFSPADIGLHRRVFGKSSIALFAAVMVVAPLLLCVIDLLLVRLARKVEVAYPFHPLFSYSQILPPTGIQSPWLRWLAAVYLGCTAGVTEEFYFRGMIRHLFPGRWPQACLFVICSTVLFVPPHFYGGPALVVLAAGYAIAAALMYLAIGNLWPLILGHILIDVGWFS